MSTLQLGQISIYGDVFFERICVLGLEVRVRVRVRVRVCCRRCGVRVRVRVADI